MRTTIKIVVLVQVILMATAAVLIFYPTIVAPPQEVTVEHLHMASLDDKETASTLDEAIKYLDENEIWNRDEMEGFKELADRKGAVKGKRVKKSREYKDLMASEKLSKLIKDIEGKDNLDATLCNVEMDVFIMISNYMTNYSKIVAKKNGSKTSASTSTTPTEQTESTIISRNIRVIE
jgi:hypothetical protein